MSADTHWSTTTQLHSWVMNPQPKKNTTTLNMQELDDNTNIEMPQERFRKLVVWASRRYQQEEWNLTNWF
jgi:hypothetical protein